MWPATCMCDAATRSCHTVPCPSCTRTVPGLVRACMHAWSPGDPCPWAACARMGARMCVRTLTVRGDLHFFLYWPVFVPYRQGVQPPQRTTVDSGLPTRLLAAAAAAWAGDPGRLRSALRLRDGDTFAPPVDSMFACAGEMVPLGARRWCGLKSRYPPARLACTLKVCVALSRFGFEFGLGGQLAGKSK